MDEKEKEIMSTAVTALINYQSLSNEEMIWCLDNRRILKYLFDIKIKKVHSGRGVWVATPKEYWYYTRPIKRYPRWKFLWRK